jgi:hypothetical protein
MSRLALIALLASAACAPDGRNSTTPRSDANVSVLSDGAVVADDGAVLPDGSPVASIDAAISMSGDCTETFRHKVVAANGDTSELAFFSKTFNLGLDATQAPDVSVWLCEHECFGSSCGQVGYGCPDAGPSGGTCQNTGTLPPTYAGGTRCNWTTGVILPDGKFFVQCGYFQKYTYTATPQNNIEAGEYAHKVYLKVH